MERDCCKIICSARTTLQGDGMENKHENVTVLCLVLHERVTLVINFPEKRFRLLKNY